MEGSDVLLTLVEVAVAFAGFSSIVVLFQRRDSEHWDFPTLYSYRAMLRNSLAAAFFSGLPFGLYYFELSAAVLWSICSGVLACFLVFPLRQFSAFVRGAGLMKMRSPRLTVLIVAGGHGAALLLQVANAVGIGFSRELAPYLVGVLWLTANSGLQFFNLVTLPLPDRPQE